MKLSEIKEIIDEIVGEELKGSKSVILNGQDTEHISRFANDFPEMMDKMRSWAKNTSWKDNVDDMNDAQVIDIIRNYYRGGLKTFAKDFQQLFETIFKSHELEGPYTVYVKTGRLAGQTVFAKKHKATGVYYYLNPDTGHDEPVGTERSLSIQKQEEGVGYVHAKDRAKDPKSIKKSGGGTEHWRIKFQSAGDLKKHGNTEKSKVNENLNNKCKCGGNLKYAADIGAPGKGQSWDCEKCKSSYVKLGNQFIDPSSVNPTEPPP